MTDRWGVDEGYWSAEGPWVEAAPETIRALHEAIAPEVPPGERGAPPGDAEPWWCVTAGEEHPLHSPATITLEDGGECRADDRLPPDLPLGIHTLTPHDGGPDTVLVVGAGRRPAPDRAWGVAAQVPALRSPAAGNHGTFAELAELGRWVQARGGGFVAHNPLGAPSPGAEGAPSPYFPSSRRWWSPLYLDLARLPGRDHAEDAVRSAQTALAVHRRRIDRSAAWAALVGALESVWLRIADSAEVERAIATHPEHADLWRFATYCALAERHGPDWRRWPAEARSPTSVTPDRSLTDRIRFRAWIQTVLDDQLADTAARIDLIADLPVGFDPAGADAWADQSLLALDCRIGAPPDTFAPDGQDWGLPPYVPHRLRAARYAPVRASVRRAARSAVALRVDHVMGLFRLYWIPPDGTARNGAYVRFAGRELFEVVALEAARCGVTLLGEDLGTVEPEVRAAMGERGALGYRVAWFEPAPPTEWPDASLGSLTTHDLPTVAGLWTGTDALDRTAAGRPVDAGADAGLRARLAATASVPPDAPVAEVVVAAHRALGAAGSALVVTQLEDLLGVEHRANLPGTVDEHPNWRLPMPADLAALARNPLAEAATAALADARTAGLGGADSANPERETGHPEG